MREPYFWSAGLDPKSRDSAPLTRLLLTPAAWIYAAITHRRLRRTVPQRVDARIICVGNIGVGGTGKSPVVAYLRTYIQAATQDRVASLSRGYGGRLTGPLKVRPETHTAQDVGDEPLMLAQLGESWIGADRARAGLLMREEGVKVIVMDDGHQNPGLAKDLSLIVVDSARGFGNGYVIPKGPLREPIAEGLARADAVILMGTAEMPQALRTFERPIFRAEIKPVAPPPKLPLVAFAGIGRPEKFFDSLTQAGGDVRDAVPFPDHHVFSAQDLQYLRDLASDHGASLITTEKDYVRLSADQRSDMLSFPVEIQFENPDMLHQLIDQTLA